MRVGDRAREDGLDGRGEEVDALEEERPLLGVEQGEARVDVQLRDVGLDLREVGVDRAVERHVGRDAPARRQADVGLRSRRSQPAVRGRPLVGAAAGHGGSNSTLRPGRGPRSP